VFFFLCVYMCVFLLTPYGNRTMKTAWNQVKFEIEGQGRLHLQMAQDLMEGVEKPLMGFKDQQKKKRKDVR